jgi:hypothetical protein
MKELERLTDDRAADRELKRLFRAGRAPEALPRGAFERSRKRVAALGAAPLGLGVLAWVQHAALGAALGTTVAVVSAWPRLVNRAPAPPAASASAPASGGLPPVAQRAPSPPAAPPSSAPAATVATTPSPAPAVPAASAAESAVLRETRLLERARAELEERPAASLRLLADHEREFPNGTLAVEREFLTVAGLLRVGQRERAEARAAALRERAPGSLYEQRLERLLGGEDAP